MGLAFRGWRAARGGAVARRRGGGGVAACRRGGRDHRRNGTYTRIPTPTDSTVHLHRQS